jgi:hypothetical protein
MFATEGATRSTAPTTAREYSSKSAASSATVPFSVLATPKLCEKLEPLSEFASPKRNSVPGTSSKFAVVIPFKFELTNPSVNYIPILAIHTIWNVALRSRLH